MQIVENNIIKILINILAKAFPCELNHDHKNAVFLAGVGRSGTTWITEIINYNREYRFIHEPFNSNREELVRDFQYKHYLRPEKAHKGHSCQSFVKMDS